MKTRAILRYASSLGYVMLALSNSAGQQRQQPQLLASVVDITGAALPGATVMSDLHDIRVSGTVQTGSGKPVTPAHVRVRFTKADGLCARKWPTQTLTSDRNGNFQLRVPTLGYFEFCASSPHRRTRCVTIDAKPSDPEQKMTLTLLR